MDANQILNQPTLFPALNAIRVDDGDPTSSEYGFQSALKDANLLTEIALKIEAAETDEDLAEGLRQNLHVWVAIQSDMAKNVHLPDDLRRDLTELAAYVRAVILSGEAGEMTLQKLETLIVINVRVATGLLEGQIRHLIGEQMYDRWITAGRPMGPQMEQWLATEEAGTA